MGRLTFQASNAQYNVIILQSNIPAGLNATTIISGTIDLIPGAGLSIQAQQNNPYVCEILPEGHLTLSDGIFANPYNHPELKITGVTDIKVKNSSSIKLKNYDPIQNITVDSGSLDFTNYYSNPNGAPVQFNLTLNNDGKFTNNVNLSPNGLENIGQVTMASGTVFEFDTANHHYTITSSRNNFVLNDLANITKIAEFIDSKFDNNITNPQVANTEIHSLIEYSRYADKDALKEFIAMNFPNVNCQLVDNFIHDNGLYIRGVCIDESALGGLSSELTALINEFAGI